jgi:hypothetical protein
MQIVDPVDPRSIPPGTHLAVSDDPGYWALRSLIPQRARLLAEDYLGPATKAIVVEVSAATRKNPRETGSVRIGRREFTGSVRDYSNWPEKWWREVIQNAVDAGASHVECGALQLPDTTWRVWCKDDGRGMTREVVRDKFLVLGETTKEETPETVGGFGQAKKLILFPWIQWTIRSRDTEFVGQGSSWTADDVAHFPGTLIEVVMPDDQHTDHIPLLGFLRKCTLPGIVFDVETATGVQSHRALYRPGKLVHEVEGVVRFLHNKTGASDSTNTLIVRTNGLYMFDGGYLPDSVKGTVTADILKPSREVLTANREGFRDAGTQREVNQFTNRLASDVKSALRAKSKMVRELYRGTGKFKADLRHSVMLAQVGPLAAAAGLTGETVSEIERLADEQLRQALDGAQTAIGPALPQVGVAREMVEAVELKGPTHLEAVFKQLVWEPDFYLINDIENWTVPQKFRPEAMTPRILKLAKVWTELVRFSFMQLGCGREFGVGWHFEEELAASYVNEEGQHWIMLNPFKDLGKRTEIWSPSDHSDLNWLYAAAIHETTHMVDFFSRHDEDFAAALTRNIARCAPGQRKIRAIAAKTRVKDEIVGMRETPGSRPTAVAPEPGPWGYNALVIGSWDHVPAEGPYTSWLLVDEIWDTGQSKWLPYFVVAVAEHGPATRDQVRRIFNGEIGDLYRQSMTDGKQRRVSLVVASTRDSGRTSDLFIGEHTAGNSFASGWWRLVLSNRK